MGDSVLHAVQSVHVTWTYQLHSHVQGHHPFAYALAELIDNSLRATRNVTCPGQPRTITISFVTRGLASSRKGLICVRDNGLGMSKQALNDWAVMNLSMEDRGQKPTEAEPARGQPALPGAGNFLTGDLSYFGVRVLCHNPQALLGTISRPYVIGSMKRQTLHLELQVCHLRRCCHGVECLQAVQV